MKTGQHTNCPVHIRILYILFALLFLLDGFILYFLFSSSSSRHLIPIEPSYLQRGKNTDFILNSHKQRSGGRKIRKTRSSDENGNDCDILYTPGPTSEPDVDTIIRLDDFCVNITVLKSFCRSIQDHCPKTVSTGPKGEKGETGSKGEKGDIGPSGPVGADGRDGAMGQRGDKGEPGMIGEKGEQGVVGLKGEKGDRGIPGTIGETVSYQDYERLGTKYFRISSYHLNFHDAVEQCKSEDGSLVKIEDTVTFNFLVEIIKQKKIKNVWIGLSDPKNDRNWSWTDGTELGSVQFWAENEPNNEHRREYCVEIVSHLNYKWNDASCYLEMHYICQFNIKPVSHRHDERLGKKYFRISSNYLNFHDAVEQCKREDGTLVKIEDTNTYNFLVEMIKQKKMHMLWIGLSDPKNNGNWSWADGTELGSVQFWAENQPNNENGREYCVEIQYDFNYKWNDEDCSQEKHYICQFNIKTGEDLI